MAVLVLGSITKSNVMYFPSLMAFFVHVDNDSVVSW